MITVIVFIRPRDFPCEGRQYRDHEWGDEVPDVEIPICSLTVQHLHCFFEMGRMNVGISEHPYPQLSHLSSDIELGG